MREDAVSHGLDASPGCWSIRKKIGFTAEIPQNGLASRQDQALYGNIIVAQNCICIAMQAFTSQFRSLTTKSVASIKEATYKTIDIPAPSAIQPRIQCFGIIR
jgi:hypothetical protein